MTESKKHVDEDVKRYLKPDTMTALIIEFLEYNRDTFTNFRGDAGDRQLVYDAWNAVFPHIPFEVYDEMDGTVEVAKSDLQTVADVLIARLV